MITYELLEGILSAIESDFVLHDPMSKLNKGQRAATPVTWKKDKFKKHIGANAKDWNQYKIPHLCGLSYATKENLEKIYDILVKGNYSSFEMTCTQETAFWLERTINEQRRAYRCTVEPLEDLRKDDSLCIYMHSKYHTFFTNLHYVANHSFTIEEKKQ